MSGQTLTEVLVPFLDGAKKILPALKRARRADGSGVDPQRTAAVLERFIGENEQLIEAMRSSSALNKRDR